LPVVLEVHAQIAALGPLSAAIEALAATVGAGVLLGGFVAGSALRILRRRDDDLVADIGFACGWAALAVTLFDLTVR
jgi:hypothetical protein